MSYLLGTIWWVDGVCLVAYMSYLLGTIWWVDDVCLVACMSYFHDKENTITATMYPNNASLPPTHPQAYSDRLQRLTIFRRYNWHSVPQQLDSVRRLLDHDFLHVLPGHGRRARFADAAQRMHEMNILLQAEGG
jgi:hypothetical protein